MATSIRRTDDPSTISFTADLEPLIMTEFSKRKKPDTARSAAVRTTPEVNSSGQSIELLDAAMKAAAVDGVISPAAEATLAQMAQSLGIAGDGREASLLILGLSTRAGLSLSSSDRS